MAEKRGWESTEAARHYLRTGDILIPGRRDILSIIARLATTFFSDTPKMLDIGCGNGDVTAEILAIEPNASVCLVDFSDEMIQLVRERFKDKGKIEIIKHDLNSGLPNKVMTTKFDAVVSCFAIHHIEYENRARLYSQIKRVLRDGGLFVNGDRFVGESPVVNQWEFDNWIVWMTKQIKTELGIDRTFDEVKRTQLESDKRLGDKPGTLWDMRDELRRTGFQYVDLLWKSHNLSVTCARKK